MSRSEFLRQGQIRKHNRLRVDSSNCCPDDSSICVRGYGDVGGDDGGDVKSRFSFIFFSADKI